jgi:carbamoylphosphate synthase large subunit
MLRLKQTGFSDKQIATRLGASEMAVRRAREALGVRPCVKQIDTLAAEFPASTNYLYVTYHGSEDDVGPLRDGIIVLGGGPYCIGSSVEFDWCAVSCARTLRAAGIKTIIVNCNPETVSTDYDESERLYFDELSLERVLDIYEREGGLPVGAAGDGAPASAAAPAPLPSSGFGGWSTTAPSSPTLHGAAAAGITAFFSASASASSTLAAAAHGFGGGGPPPVGAPGGGMGVIVSVGGQIPNNLAMPLMRQNVRILGTSPADIDKAEDRNKFSKLLDALGVDQPPWRELTSVDDIRAFVADVGFPVLIRPSYVLSGAAMRVASNEEQLRSCLAGAAAVSAEHPVVVSKFIVNAKEIEFDAVAKGGKVLNYAISEHVENAGVHSGDATLVLPAQKLYVETIRQVKRISQAIARALNISGPFNIQFMSRENEVKVIECNLRASRSFPFISKTFDFNFIALATKVMAGLPAKPGSFSLVDVEYVGIKAPQFSFTRLQGADPTLGVEMVSTGEVACFGVDMYEAFLLSIQAAGFRLPERTRNILVSFGTLGKPAMLESCQRLQRLGYHLFATEGTKLFLEKTGGMRDVTEVFKNSSLREPKAATLIQQRKVDLVINDPETGDKESETDGYVMRRAAVDFGVSLITNVKCAVLLSLALERVKTFHVRSIEEYTAAQLQI